MSICHRLIKLSLCHCVSLILVRALLMAGPPFVTDDPDAVAYKHGEAYVGSVGSKASSEFYAFLPFIEFDYGAFKNTQLHCTIPFSIDKKVNNAASYGLGMVELGVKYRIIAETKTRPQFGTFPLVELPTANARKGLGSGKIQFFLPIWLQKSWGEHGQQWTTYGGGGYWFNPGLMHEDYWFFGWVLQREITQHWWHGFEVFYQTKAHQNGDNSFGFNVGGGLTIHKDWQVIYSFGRHTGLGQFLYYVALYHIW